MSVRVHIALTDTMVLVSEVVHPKGLSVATCDVEDVKEEAVSVKEQGDVEV